MSLVQCPKSMEGGGAVEQALNFSSTFFPAFRIGRAAQILFPEFIKDGLSFMKDGQHSQTFPKMSLIICRQFLKPPIKYH